MEAEQSKRKAEEEETRPSIRVSSTPRPRAVISSMVILNETYKTTTSHTILYQKMQAALSLAPSPLSIVTTTKPFPPCKSMLKLQTPRGFKATPVGQDNSTVDYSSTASVFPAEACDTLGGEACDVEMFPEVKLKPDQTQSNKGKTGSEQVDREYLEYNSPKTVFIGEACDDLGGEFCEPEYQKGVQ
ncbi:hypothetical protein GOBAR_AA18551 [Gossypium barbadense]|uniref:Light-regulated protein n=2 Tax=Gossypium barbadense TaxID=3634 RepID=A0A2P5XFI3_GOSBA|nr:hypothetical protein GOBAR_AA18551 [Gossypium barbadense]